MLQVVDGIKGVWHGGPFSTDKRFRFLPKQMMFGTDPVAIDRLILDIVDNQRKAMGAISVWDRDPRHLRNKDTPAGPDPNVNAYIREPGHIEYASTLGLGVYELEKIRVKRIDV